MIEDGNLVRVTLSGQSFYDLPDCLYKVEDMYEEGVAIACAIHKHGPCSFAMVDYEDLVKV